MERSTKFISLSGLSGVLAGIYALTGAFIGYNIIYKDGNELGGSQLYIDASNGYKIVLTAIIILAVSILTGFILSINQSKKLGQNFWNAGSRRLFGSLAIPLVVGGLFLLILMYNGDFQYIAPTCLIFYGLALVSGSQFTYSDVKYLGFLEIILGFICAIFPGYGIIFWAIGFGVLHILYGTIMHLKYKQ